MRYQLFTPQAQSTYPVAILAPKLDQTAMEREYLDPICLPSDRAIAYELHQTGKKTPVTAQRAFLDDLIPLLDDLQSKYLIVGDGDYFKTLTGAKKADPYLGYVLPNTYPESLADRFHVVYVPNYRQVFYDPGKTRGRIRQGLNAFWNHAHGRYREPGCSILSFSAYPENPTDIASWLQRLIDMDCDLSCDIEGFSLKHFSAGIGTVSFAWNQHEGIAFPVDLGPNPPEVRRKLKEFFVAFRQSGRTMNWHNASYDATVLVYQLFMKSLIDQEGLLEGLDVLLGGEWDDTKLVAYVATNTCAGNELSLKAEAQEFAGNYAQEDIKDITKIPLPQLLEYNLVDGLSTWFVRSKRWDKMVQDQQLEVYQELLKPAVLDIVQMQLTGMPLDMYKVAHARSVLETDRAAALASINASPTVQSFIQLLNQETEEHRRQDWEDRKAAGVKVRSYVPGNHNIEFNPNSTPQLQRLFYEELELPVIERTKTKLPATGAEVLEKLKAFTQNQGIKDLIDALMAFAEADKILGTFIKAMEEAQLAPDGCYYLFGSFNLGGTVSGRLSSSDPNLQNLPARGKYAKLIKDCFRPPKGWLMVGLDFDSLEDRISALTTRDPNKLKVYTDGFDGHCLRAYSYFGERMSANIDPSDPESINSIAEIHEDLRQDSKVPTFLLTYGGTWIGLIAKAGFAENVARQIEARYHEMYQVSDEWVQSKLDQAAIDGYVTVAFGLRVRTPLLHQVVRGTRATPYEAEAEGRTAGNALGQSWCLLNTRASVEFMRKARASRFRLMIRPIAHIHDAQYYLIPDDLDVLLFLNEHLVKAVNWQDHPEIWHPDVKLGGGLSIFHPSWAHEIKIPNGALKNDVIDKVAEKTQAQEAA